MCKGVEQGETQPAVRQRRSSDEATASAGGGGDPVPCELCGSRASLYCQADEAYLCRRCDKSVHGANFLALRHVRCLLCNTCQSHTQRYLLGESVEVVLPSIVSSAEGNYRNYPCDRDDLDQNCSQVLKTPCLFLWSLPLEMILLLLLIYYRCFFFFHVITYNWKCLILWHFVLSTTFF